ncbi:SUMF1/EgtB/PvdO family nonheme iron enzyme [Sphingomonas bacterium]|uniref:SUMF1/EgtB/PvdO family nonheme iron enzyme n=1 Tax=Sphingomonas bacterium TaxID=1895847 RepID=UPI00157702EC|nr:SUMF1/EgtB/PvdO family nonheme iron enzyme [Sphingomonas bacterium]
MLLAVGGLMGAKLTGIEDRMVAVPAGMVLLGEDGSGVPGTSVGVAAFRIDPHEVTNRQFAAFVAATRYRTQAEREGGAPVFVMPRAPVSMDDPAGWWKMIPGAGWRHPLGPDSTIVGHMDDPVVQVSYDDAAAYAAWAGGRLPTATEWERAARGDQSGARSPTSWIRDAAGGAIANSWQGIFPIRDTGDDGHVGIAPVESYRPNSFGLYDMVGNVWEWTSTEGARGTRTLKGGSFLCAANYCANYRPAAWQAQEHDLGASHIGFRIVAPVVPVRMSARS